MRSQGFCHFVEIALKIIIIHHNLIITYPTSKVSALQLRIISIKFKS